jgi:hypothetical protein
MRWWKSSDLDSANAFHLLGLFGLLSSLGSDLFLGLVAPLPFLGFLGFILQKTFCKELPLFWKIALVLVQVALLVAPLA